MYMLILLRIEVVIFCNILILFCVIHAPIVHDMSGMLSTYPAQNLFISNLINQGYEFDASVRFLISRYDEW